MSRKSEAEVLRDFLASIALAKSLADVNIAAGIAAQELGSLPAEGESASEHSVRA